MERGLVLIDSGSISKWFLDTFLGMLLYGYICMRIEIIYSCASFLIHHYTKKCWCVTGSSAARWLPWDPSNIPWKIPEMAIKWNYCYYCYYYYTVILFLEASPMGLWDSLNCFTIVIQPPLSFVACLASSGIIVCVHLNSQSNPQSETKYGQIQYWHCYWIRSQQDLNPVLSSTYKLVAGMWLRDH